MQIYSKAVLIRGQGVPSHLCPTTSNAVTPTLVLPTVVFAVATRRSGVGPGPRRLPLRSHCLFGPLFHGCCGPSRTLARLPVADRRQCLPSTIPRHLSSSRCSRCTGGRPAAVCGVTGFAAPVDFACGDGRAERSGGVRGGGDGRVTRPCGGVTGTCETPRWVGCWRGELPDARRAGSYLLSSCGVWKRQWAEPTVSGFLGVVLANIAPLLSWLARAGADMPKRIYWWALWCSTGSIPSSPSLVFSLGMLSLFISLLRPTLLRTALYQRVSSPHRVTGCQ